MKHAAALVALVTTMSSLLPLSASAEAFPTQPFEQDFILSAYYSPLPDQCCYVRGSYDADRILNGNGTNAADGTPVYPGMIAAPSLYPFGTKIQLPGIGILTVHDRGGAIKALENVHRLDIWMGSGEEGLARAMAFGMRTVRGIVYPKDTGGMETTFDLSSFAAPESVLQRFLVEEDTEEPLHEAAILQDSIETEKTDDEVAVQQQSVVAAAFGETGDAVRLLQQDLTSLGYFEEEVTGYFGDVTRGSLSAFLTDMGLHDESSDAVSDVTDVYLRASRDLQDAEAPFGSITPSSSINDIAAVQRYLRHLGFYRGRTDGQFTQVLRNAVIAYQLHHGIVQSAESPGAGLVGPLTTASLVRVWKAERIVQSAQRTFALRRVQEMLAQRDEPVSLRLVRTTYMVVRSKGWDAL